MAFKKGHKKIGGRTSKSPNKKQKISKEFMLEVATNPSLRKKYIKELKSDDLKGKQFIDAYNAMLEFSVPKFNKIDPNANKLPAAITINMIAAKPETTIIDISHAEIDSDNQGEDNPSRLQESNKPSR